MLYFVVAAAPAGAQTPNLLPNGDVEDEFVNHIRVGEKRTTTMEAWNSGESTFWKRGHGASLDRETVHGGKHSIALQADEQTAEATVFSDYWRVKDSTMPFGLPLAPGRPVEISFHVKTSPTLAADAFSAEIRLGTIDGLPSETQTVSMGPEAEWKRIAMTMTPEALRWGVSITFRAAGNLGDGQVAWIDDVSVTQDLGERLNLVHNPGFEQMAPGSPWPVGWEAPMDDQWVSWVGGTFRAPTFSPAAYSSEKAMRCTVTYAEVSGLSQVVHLNQEAVRPIAIGLWAKLDNSIGNSAAGGGYYGSDNLPNLTIFVYHQDGTMQEVSPTFCLGESDHDWDYLRGGFMPQKPVARIRLQATVLGTEPTTSLWLDNVEAFELDSEGSSLPSAVFAPKRTLYSAWGGVSDSDSGQVQAAMNDERLSLFIPRAPEGGERRVFLNPSAWAPTGTHQRYLFKVIRLQENGQIGIADAVEKQGLIAEGQFGDAAESYIGVQMTMGGWAITVPWRALGLDGAPEGPIGFNVQQSGADGDRFWTGKSAAVAETGILVPPAPRGLSIRSIRFGNRYEHETDQTRDPVSQPPLYAGMNDGTVWIANSGPATEFTLTAGVRGRAMVEVPVSIESGETKRVAFPYDAGSSTYGSFDIALRRKGELLLEDTYPLVSPEPMELVPDQEHYFPEETEAVVEVHARYRPLPEKGRAEVIVRDLEDNSVVTSLQHEINAPVSTFRFPLDTLRINSMPVQDYTVELSWYDDQDALIGMQFARFGRIHHTVRHPLPAVESVLVDETGRLMINGDFPFFPVVPSLSNEAWDAGIDLGGNMYRPIYSPGSDNPDLVTSVVAAADRAWSKNVYLMPIGPGPGQVETFEKEVPAIFAHPGFLGAYPKQFYYWNLDDAQVAYRNQMEGLFAAQPSKRLLVWGHHDSSFLYDHDVSWPDVHPAVGYCYTHIMGRPGSGWRNGPFLTRTEQVLDPGRFKLAEVNLYMTWHDDEIVPEHFSTYYSLRADAIAGFRNESYLSVIYGADGLYHYICTQTGGLQRLRGWFQELNFMWPVFAADDSEIAVTVSPASSGVEARLKSHEGRLYLLTANASERPTEATIRIHGLDGMTVKKCFDLTGALTVEGDTLHDRWGAQDAFVYEITGVRLKTRVNSMD
jgi:hypothetical protein